MLEPYEPDDMRQSPVKKLLHAGVIALLVLCALANFYRNQDPYRAYFHQRKDHYLTTHLIDSELQPFSQLECRMRSVPPEVFYQAVMELYAGKQLLVPGGGFFESERLQSSIGIQLLKQATPFEMAESAVTVLLREARYSFLYSPLAFSPLRIDVHVRCDEYNSPWQEGEFPLMVVLVPGSHGEPNVIQGVRHGKYLFFLPDTHPVLRQSS